MKIQQSSIQAIKSIQNDSLLDRLNQANSRILTLEARERQLNIEKDRWAQLAKLTLEEKVRDEGEHTLWPAARLSQMIESLTIVQRRDAWLSALVSANLGGALATLFPHAGNQDEPFAILVRGSGGYGDLLYLSMVVRELFMLFDRPKIIVLHEHPGAAEVFSNNPYVLGVASLTGSSHLAFLQVACSLDVFDLVADVRYAVSYTVPPLSRVPQDFVILAHARSAPWQRYIRREWPYLNNLLAQEARHRGFSQYELMGYTANLPIARDSMPAFFPSEPIPEQIRPLLWGSYVTVHHGADRFMSNSAGLATKNLPLEKWIDIVDRCKAIGLRTVQVGASHEPEIEGIDVDLRGRTSLSQSALVLKYALAHLDTEGGLVHLANAMGTKSIVAFGPTPTDFFGYPNNQNLAPGVCGNCWWITADWATQCPRGLAEPECMTSHSVQALVDSLPNRDSALIDAHADVVSATLDKAVAASLLMPDRPLSGTSKGLLLVNNSESVAQCLGLLRASIGEPEVVVPLTKFPDFARLLPYTRLSALSLGHIPTQGESIDWVVCDLGGMPLSDVSTTLADALRVLRPASSILLRIESESLEDELFAIRNAIDQLPGGRCRLIISKTLEAMDAFDSADRWIRIQRRSQPNLIERARAEERP